MDPLAQHSVIVPDTETDTAGPIRRNAINSTVQLTVQGSCRTCYESFRNGAFLAPGGPCLGWRPIDSTGQAGPYIFMTYNEALARIDCLHNALVGRNAFGPNEDGMKLLGIYSRNRPEWVISEQACFCAGGATVPLYDTLGADTVEYILSQTGVSTVVCGTMKEADATLRVGKGVKLVIVVEPLSQEDRAHLKSVAVNPNTSIATFDEIEAEGRRFGKRVKHMPPGPSSIATFCYTSGTTGQPKGALISHQNIMAAVSAVEISGMIQLSPSDVHLSYLPLPHIFERVVQVAMYAYGARVGFFQGDPLKLLDDMQALRPTNFASVPRVLNRIYDKIMSGVAAVGGTKEALFRRALAAKTEGLKEGKLSHWLWDRLIFNKIKVGLGLDRVNQLITGSAPISPDVLNFFRCVLGCNVLEGYGQTEGAASTTVTVVGDYSAGHVGPPVPAVEVRLVDVPELGYLHTDTWHGNEDGMPCIGRGEICYRGPLVFEGYYKMPEKTAETIDADGWLQSGDIGLWTLKDAGDLKIIDRKKNIFKLSQGEYVAAEKIENILSISPYMAQVFVYGDSLQSYLVAIIIPDQEAVEAKLQGDFKQLCADPSSSLYALIKDEITRLSKESKLAGFECVRKFHLSSEAFSVEDGTLTPTFKLKRQAAQAKYPS